MDPCIVCLAELPDKNLPRTGADGLPISYNLDDLAEFLLARLPCSHFMHNSCLKPWVERANSCPICRKAFNVVELVTSPTGEPLSSYVVDDKTQVSESNDHNILPSGANENERGRVGGGFSHECFICNESGYSDLLLFCDDCRSPYHTYCLGIEAAPGGLWYCPPCVIERPSLGSRNNDSRPTGRRNRTRPNYDPWERVWLTIGGRYEALEVEYSTNNEDDGAPEPIERDINAWHRRIDVARRLGAAEVLNEAVPRILERLPLVEKEPEMSAEEKEAWAMLEEAEDALLHPEEHEEEEEEEEGEDEELMDETQDHTAGSNAAASRKRRLSKLLTSSPQAERNPREDGASVEPQDVLPESPSQPVPERKLKRPRTRRLVPQSLANLDSPPVETIQPRRLSADAGSNSPTATRDPAPSSPTLLDTLLADIDKVQPSTMAGLKFPRPISSNRPTFLPPSSPLTPPTEGPESSPSSPSNEYLQPQEVTLPHSPPAEPSSPPPRQDSASPSGLSLSNKKEVEKLVRLALAPHYHAGDMSSDQFAEINKAVSRVLYNKITGDGRIREWEKSRWMGYAKKEVEKHVEILRGSKA
ncbi:hypothetical protein TWF788_009934 [Orbilia oligospora]|uniref:PHD-type domain-containing protein n=1 Tax=Orbilia oligospora TaxID=2813651 RepID=A0A7C8PQJ5_ORBOL|nr:hypothetical protein TWF788_009934 [Orbilia oligospora]